MARGSALRLGLLAAGVLALHLALLQGWRPRPPGGDAQRPPGFAVRMLPGAAPRVSDPAPASDLADAALPATPPTGRLHAEPEAWRPPPRLPSPATPTGMRATAEPPGQPTWPADRAAATSISSETLQTAATPALAPVASPPSPATATNPGGLMAAAVPTVAVPPPARWHYEVTGSARGQAVRGEARLDWQHDGEQYEARMEWGGEGLPPRSHRSSGRLGAEGLQPRRFAERQRTELATHLDAEAGRIVFSGNQPPQALLPGQQDRLSLLVQVAALIGGEPARYPAGTRLSIPTATARGAEPWQLEVTGEEDLPLGGGVVRALKLERRPVALHDQRVEIWLAPAAGHAPVRLRVTQAGGDWLDQRWRTLDGR